MLAWHLSSEPEEHFVDDLFALRRAIEPMAAEIAATSRTPDSLARIAEAFGRMERFRNGDGDLIGADVDFHVAILEATGNHFLAALGGLIQAALAVQLPLHLDRRGEHPRRPLSSSIAAFSRRSTTARRNRRARAWSSS